MNNLSPDAAHAIDMEIDALVTKAYQETKDTLELHLSQLEIVKDRLLDGTP